MRLIIAGFLVASILLFGCVQPTPVEPTPIPTVTATPTVLPVDNTEAEVAGQVGGLDFDTQGTLALVNETA